MNVGQGLLQGAFRGKRGWPRRSKGGVRMEGNVLLCMAVNIAPIIVVQTASTVYSLERTHISGFFAWLPSPFPHPQKVAAISYIADLGKSTPEVHGYIADLGKYSEVHGYMFKLWSGREKTSISIFSHSNYYCLVLILLDFSAQNRKIYFNLIWSLRHPLIVLLNKSSEKLFIFKSSYLFYFELEARFSSLLRRKI